MQKNQYLDKIYKTYMAYYVIRNLDILKNIRQQNQFGGLKYIRLHSTLYTMKTGEINIVAVKMEPQVFRTEEQQDQET